MAKMVREEFLAACKRVSAAISGRDLIPVFSCLCFGEKSVHAYDDVVALQFPLVSGLSGGIRGSLLLGWIGEAKAKELEVSQEGDNVTLKAGRAKLVTPIIASEDFLFKPPAREDASQRALDAEFLDALAKASISLGRDPSHPNRLGVTVVFSDEGSLFYSTNDRTACRVKIGKPASDAIPVVLPPRFVELLGDVGKSDAPTKMYLTKDWVEVKFTSGLRLFSRTMSTSDVDAFKNIFTASKMPYSVAVPKGFDRALQRAQSVVSYAKDPFTKITADGNRLKLATKTPAGNVFDAVPLAEEIEGGQSIEVLPDLVAKGLPHAEKFCILPDRIVMTGASGFTYLVSNVSRADEGSGTQEAE
jgi:DNA polymerase III sliding clamp (beta) subunit (PCNA family)